MLRGSAIVVIGLLSICGLCWAQSSTSPSVASPTPLDADRARVFLTDSESWEMSGASGGSSARTRTQMTERLHRDYAL